MTARLTRLTAAASLALAALAAQTASAVPGSFSPTGSMTVPRCCAAAAPLPDGRVLVAGGHRGLYNLELKDAEIFDPATGSFSPTGSLSVPRSGAVGAPLPDGRVLVAGGFGENLRSAEIFDPATGSFSPTGSMAVGRSGAAVAPLPDGRVLIAGGSTDAGATLLSAEIFDPATDTFSPTGSMLLSRTGAAGAPLPYGRVLVAGGGYIVITGGWHDEQGALLFDAAKGQFSGAQGLTVPRIGPAAAPLPDGRVLVAGGSNFLVDENQLKSAEIFDPMAVSSVSFLETGSMTIKRGGAAAAPLPDGRVLIAGGEYPYTASAELFTPGLSYKLRGKRLAVPVAVAGTLTAADVNARRGSSAAVARRLRRLLKPTSAQGGPGSINVKLNLTKRAKRKLHRTGKVRVRTRIAFTPAPVRGQCVTLFNPCYSSGYAISETATLTLKAKRYR